MKKQTCMLALLALMSALLPSARAQEPEIAAVYAAVVPGKSAGAEPETKLLYVLEDGSGAEYVLRGGELVSGPERTDVTGEKALRALGYIQIYPPQEEPAAPALAESTAEPAPAGTEETVDEGTDTAIEITGYATCTDAPAAYFPAPGDKIAVISPSALPGREQTEATVEGLRSWGFEPVLGKHVYSEVRTLEQCIEDFRWALEDPEIKAVFCVRGGYGATEVMDALRVDLFPSAPKPIIGYSDITAYHGAWTIMGLPSIHACMSGAFADFPEACAEAERHMILGQIPAYTCEADPLCKTGTAEGVLIGGNLSTFVASLDTDYDSTKLDEPYILFLEEVGENMQHIHRYLTVLKHQGILDHAAGIVFGEWTELPADGRGNYGEARGGLFDSVADMIARQFLNGVDIPVAFGFPSGHGEANYPLLMGAKAKLAVGKESYTLSWTAES